MGDIKPLGSEKLQGDDKLKRILELTYFNKPKKSTSKSETIKESTGNGVFGIVKEKDGYYVKKGLNENSLDYIGGLFMKNKNKFQSHGDALKRMNLLCGQENLQEATKFVLKQNKPVTPAPEPEAAVEAPAPEPSMDSEVPSMEPTPETPTEPSPESGETSGNSENELTGKRSDYMAEIQKYAGKLGQQLRDEHERMESDDIKYVLNMIISAVDLNKLDDEDLEDIAKKFEREDDELPNGEDFSSDVPAEDEGELGEGMDKLSKFIESNFSDEKNEIDLSKYADLGSVEETKEIDMDEMKSEINARIGETLSKYFK